MKNDLIAKLADQTLWITKHNDVFKFVSVGGSVGRNKISSSNDVDYFIHCNDADIGIAKRLLQDEIACRYSASGLVGTPELVDGFGIRFGFFSFSSEDIDYFLVSPALVGNFESFSHHLLIHGDRDDFFRTVNRDYCRATSDERVRNEIGMIGFRVLHFCKKMTRSYTKCQYFETERYALLLRAIAYGIKKKQDLDLSFDWYSCNRLDRRVSSHEFNYFVQGDSTNWPFVIPKIIDHFIQVFERYDGLGAASMNATISELKKLTPNSD